VLKVSAKPCPSLKRNPLKEWVEPSQCTVHFSSLLYFEQARDKRVKVDCCFLAVVKKKRKFDRKQQIKDRRDK
jgi:hypothetical protein